MKYNLIIKIIVITLTGLPVLLKAQINDSFTLQQYELIFQKNDIFDELITKDNTFTDEIGNPKLPVHFESFVVPFDATVTGIQINSVTIQKIKGNFNIYPTQPPRYLDGSDQPAFVEPNPDVYNSSEPYPGKTVEIVSDEYMHGYHVVTVKIYPVEYFPKSQKINIQNVSYTINYSSSKLKNSSIIQSEKQSYKRAELAKQYIKWHVKNAYDVDNFKNKNVRIINESSSLNYVDNTDEKTMMLKSTSAIEELVPDYIIITNNALKPTFQILAGWKTKKGVPTIIKTVEEIEPNYPGSDLPEKIRNYLKEAYSKWGADLFILLGGDVNIVPARMKPNKVISTYTDFYLMKPTDLYYTTIGGTWNANNNNIYGEENFDNIDYGRDFYLGRAPVENIQEANIFVNKIITYEKAYNVSNLNYYNNILIANGFHSKNECGVLYSEEKSGLKEICDNFMSANINKWFMFDDHYCNPIGPYAYEPYEREYCNPDDPTVSEYVRGGDCIKGDVELSKNNFIAALNNGGSSGLGYFHIVYHKDHSGTTGMGTSSTDKEQSIKLDDFDNLTNGHYGAYYQILMSGGCSPATFTQDCMGERYINNANGGGVAFIGNSDEADAGYWNQLQGFVNSIYETTGHPSSGRFDIGCAFQSAIEMNPVPNWRLTLLGDPEMQIWTYTPQTLSVTVSPTTIVSGENTIIVTLNNLPYGKTATICLQKGDEGYATKTVSTSGNYYFTFTPHTSGQIYVTVTAHNYKPYENTITVNTNQNQNIYISNLIFDDDKTGGSRGNNDQQVDAGETIELTIELKNNGATSASNVSATLTSSSTHVSISGNQSSFGNIASGGTKTSLSKYVFTINKNAPEILVNDLNPAKFYLQITDGASNSYTDVFNIDVFAPEIEQANKTIVTTSDGDKIIEPNETVTINIDLFNQGKAQATVIKGLLSGNSSYITSCSATYRYYPAIGKFGTGTNTSVYQFTVSPYYTEGQALDFILQVENEYLKKWSFNFNLLDKPAKINISTIDFIANTTEIELFWTPYTNIGGYNIYRCDADVNGNPVGNYQKINTFPVPAAYFKDFGLNELTKYLYKISSVSITRNESELSDAFLAWTSYPQKGLFPIQMDIQNGFDIRSSINVADINNDNLLEIFTTIKVDNKNSYIIGLNHYGAELYDIDGNGTTYNGFVHVDGNVESLLAIGDLDVTGNYQVISSTRDASSSPANYFYCHSVNDNNHDNIPDLLWYDEFSNRTYRGPIISNIDNSSDGSMEVIFYGEWDDIVVYKSNGQIMLSINIKGSYGAPAVADIDNDGDKEIIIGNSAGICIFHHNGTIYGSGLPFYSLTGYKLGSSIIVCDIDNDSDKEILTSALKLDYPHEGRIVALHHNGIVVSGWNGNQKIAYPNNWHSQDISVGDLNNDGNIEVVAIGTNIVKVWSKSGTLISSTDVNNLDPGKLTPILADVDNDAEIEIIFGSTIEAKIYALNMNGTKVFGFPLQIDEPLQGSPCVADVDNNGKNEIIAGSGNKIYMWRTSGNSQSIEWGSERHDSHNTGVYHELCPPVIITSNTTWTTNKNLCGDIIINSGTLTIASTCIVTMSDYTRILVRSGGGLKVDAGKLINTSIKALSGSNVILKNNGYIKIREYGEFNINTGATYDYQYGTLDITQ